MYVALSGAKKNLGDFLITERCRALLEKFRPERELVVQPAWEKLPATLLERARAIVIMGGPGYQRKFYPQVYPLVPSLEDLPCPVVPIGLGWKGIPGDDLTVEDYRFSPQSLNALRWMSERFPSGLGCRDHLTVDVLKRHSIHNPVMTGCPAWYSLDSIGRPLRVPGEIRRLVFTPPQLAIYRDQSLELASQLGEIFPGAERIGSFHRGIDQVDKWTFERDALNNRQIASALKALGYRIVDVSGGLEKVAFYDDCDLHVGYRLHAHIDFLSKRRPSLLLHEDGRGRGASGALGVAGVDAFQRTMFGNVAHGSKVLNLARATHIGGLAEYRASGRAVSQARNLLELDLANGFNRYAGVPGRIDASLHVMRDFLLKLP